MLEPGPAFLGVEQSVTGRRWSGLTPTTDRLAARLGQEHGLPDLLCRILARQGVDAHQVTSFLEPKLSQLMPDPSSIRDMDIAVERFNMAVEGSERIAIFADYDVDGGSAGALLTCWLRELGITATLYVPERLSEGFGPNERAMKQLTTDHDLILCVDCGTTAHLAIAAADGTDVIVIDHHAGDPSLPPAIAVVNPNRQDDESELGYLCAAGVVYMFLVATNRIRRRAGKVTPDLMKKLDLVALATVADVVPLIGLNRAFVRRGLEVLSMRARPGLRALVDSAGIRCRPDEFHLGYVLGPRINAGGRIGQSDLGARLLATSDEIEAQSLADKLDGLNRERRALVDRITEKAIEQAKIKGIDKPLVWAADDGWHPGVAGIVASRLSELAHRPAIVIGINGECGKGSGRSIHGIDLGSAITRAREEGLLNRGGGHAMAAGLEVAAPNIITAMERIEELISHQGSNQMVRKDLQVDGQFLARGVNCEIIEMLSRAGPYGSSSPRPCFAMPSQVIHYRQRIGETHLRVAISGEDDTRMNAIAFNAFDSEIGSTLNTIGNRPLHVAGTLQINDWQGRRRPELKILDVALA